MRKSRTIAVTAGAGALAATLLTAAATMAPAASAASAAPAGHTTPATAQVTIRPGARAPEQARTLATPWNTALCESQLKIACYQPSQLQAAYNEAPLFSHGITGKGSTIVIVDSFGSPTIKADLATFDKQFGLAAPPSFKVITPAGQPPAWDPGNSDMTGWAGETTLDVEYAHTIAPGANILLVETPVSETEGTTGFPEIVKAEEYVVNHHLGDVISQSFGATEPTFTGYKQLAPLRAAYLDAYAHGVTVLGSSGDDGATDAKLNGTDLYTHPVTSWPAGDPLVTGVGGTQLKESASGTFSSVAWNDTFDVPLQQAFTGTDGPNAFASGGGKSIFFGRPAYQNSVAKVTGGARGVPDISMSGACDGAVTTYSSYPGDPVGWHLTCGTSESAPEFAGIVALTVQVAHHKLGLINPALYALSKYHAPGVVDVTKGDNTVAFTQGADNTLFTVKGFPAKRGYDLVTGVGTVNAAAFVPELAQASQY
jgi:subtilase family serine protease